MPVHGRRCGLWVDAASGKAYTQGTFATKATAKSDVGKYEVTLSGAEARNYTFEYEPGTLTVTKAPLTAEVENAQRAYGADNPQFTAKYTGFVNGDTEAVLTNLGTFATEATKESPAGEYAITLTGVDAKNYEVTTIAGKLTIGIAKLTMKVNDAERMYGDENPAFTYTLTGLMNGDKEEDVLISTGTFTTKATAKSDVGEYEVTLSGVEARNYTIEYEPGTLTVTKAPLTAEVQNAQRAYGADNPQFTAKYTGFVNGDTEAALTNLGTFATEATKESPAGEYAITLTGADAKNYEVTTIAGKLTIGIAKLTVKVNNAERVYGNENPAFTYTLTGLMNGEKEEDVLISAGTFTTEATKMSDVGEYAVKCLDVKAKNYEVETIDGVLKVTPAQIIVRVNNATRPYGEDNPQFTALYIGFHNNETDDVLTNNSVFSTSATKTSDVGEYEITATDAQAKNYTFEYEPGTLTIEQAEQQIVWDQELGDIAQFMQIELTATATSGLAVSYQVTQGSDVCSVVKVGKTTFLDCFGTGDVTLSAWQEGNKNYFPTLRTYKQVKVVPTGIGHVEAGDYTVVTKRGQLLIGGLKDGDTVQVTDLAGRTVYSGEESTIYVTRGSYIVRIGHWMKKVLMK